MAVHQVYSGPTLTSGDVTAEFERRFADYMGAPYAVGTSSCTMALKLALRSCGVQPGDEVITTPLTYIATAQAICGIGADPVFVDVEEETGNLDVSKVAAAVTRRTAAVVPVHLYGWMCDMHELEDMTMRYALRLVEDAAHCVEGQRDGLRPGMVGNAACFSFYATKSITCGEGGAVVTHSKAFADKVRLLSKHAVVRNPNRTYCNNEMGYKGNLDNVRASVLLEQVGGINSRWMQRRWAYLDYDRCLSGVDRATPAAKLDGHACHLYPIRVPEQHRDSLIEHLGRRGIEASVHYRSLTELAYFRRIAPAHCPIAEKIGRQTLSLPLWPGMPTEVIEEVCEAVREYFR